jgi:hypothetical protein
MIRRKHAAAAAVILALALSVFAQSTPIRVDGNVIKGYIAILADASHQGRKTLSHGHEMSVQWAADLFKKWGVQPAGENGTYIQGVPIPGANQAFAERLGVPELTIGGRSFLIRDNDFSVDASSTALPKPVTGDLVFVGYGISAPDKGLDEYNVDVKGKIVLAFKGSPDDAPPFQVRMGGGAPTAPPSQQAKVWTLESEDAYKAKVAYDKGAAAILFYNPPAATAGRGGAPAAAAPPAGGRGRPEVKASPFVRPFEVISINDERVFRWIMWRNPQQALNEFTAGIDQMRRDIKDKKIQTKNTGMKATVKGYEAINLYGEPFKSGTSHNVLGKIPGTDPNLKNQYVILGGHLDHLGVTNGVVFNGADDNASGAATAMEVARLLAVNKVQPKRTIVIGLWCGEEEGEFGSDYYGDHPCDGVTMDHVVGYFNMDMVGLGDGIGIPGSMNFPEIYSIIKRNQDPSIKLTQETTTGTGGSDYSAFIKRGIEALGLMTSGGTGHPDYHQSGDDIEKIDPKILGQTGQFVLQGVLNLAAETQVNLLIPDRQLIYDAEQLRVIDMRSDSSSGRGGRGGGGGGWQFVNASNNVELMSLINDRAKTLTTQAQQPQTGAPGAFAGARGGGGGGARYTTGVRDAGIFEGSIPLMTASTSLLGFGRVDVAANDGAWFNFNSGVSAQGREAIKAMEANNITVNLTNPSSKLLSDVLDATTKPFLVTVTGSSPIDQTLISRMNQKNTLLLFECDPADVQGCANKLQNYKKQFGDSDNLVVSMKSGANQEEAKKNIYLALIKSGWTKDEVYAVFGASAGGGGGRGGGAGGNLSKLVPARGAGGGH